MFRKKKINASSNLKRGLHFRTKRKSNGGLDIETEGVYSIDINNSSSICLTSQKEENPLKLSSCTR